MKDLRVSQIVVLSLLLALRSTGSGDRATSLRPNDAGKTYLANDPAEVRPSMTIDRMVGRRGGVGELSAQNLWAQAYRPDGSLLADRAGHKARAASSRLVFRLRRHEPICRLRAQRGDGLPGHTGCRTRGSQQTSGRRIGGHRAISGSSSSATQPGAPGAGAALARALRRRHTEES